MRSGLGLDPAGLGLGLGLPGLGLGLGMSGLGLGLGLGLSGLGLVLVSDSLVLITSLQKCNKTANINVKKLQFIHKLTASDTSKTAKITSAHRLNVNVLLSNICCVPIFQSVAEINRGSQFFSDASLVFW